MQKFLKFVFEFRTVLFFVGVIIAFWLISNTVRVIQKNYHEQQQVDELEQQIAVLGLENQNLRLNNEFYKTDSYLELETRRRLSKVAAGEKVLILPKQNPSSADRRDGIEDGETTPQYRQNFDEWLQFLFGKESG